MVAWVTVGIALASWGCLILAAGTCLMAVRHTSLITAWRWMSGAGLAVCVMTSTDLLFSLWPGHAADYGWCLTSILLLSPPIAVLGARRPGVHIWSLFILLPMVAVLSWPIWTMLLQGSEWRGLALEFPTVLVFALVSLMGSGNFLGTRFAMSALLYSAGVLGLFLTCTGWTFVAESAASTWRLGSILALESAALYATASTRPAIRRHRVNQLWNDFRNLFGIVWALRMVERINALAVQEKWIIRISLEGFPETTTGGLTVDEIEIEAACRWLFRRFVDDEWISRRLGPQADGSKRESQTALAATTALR